MRNILLNNSYLNLLRHNRSYRYLWLSQVVSQLGDWFNLIASAALVAHLSGASLAIGGLFLARLLPPFLLGPLAGVVADRFDRRKILMATDLFRALIVPGFLLVDTAQEAWLVYALTVLQLSISAFFEPARAAIVPNIVGRDKLVDANALASATWSVMLALGAALGGAAASLFGVQTAFVLDALTFLVSAILVSQIRLPILAQEAESGPAPGWSAFVDGLAYLRQRPAILIIALLKTFSAVAGGGMMVVEVAFAEEQFPLGGDGSGTLGLILFMAGVGTGVGPLVARRLTGDDPVAMHWGVLLAYLAALAGYLLLGWSYSLPLLLLATFVRGLGGGANWVYSSSLLQILVPDRYLGRVFAFDIAMMTLASAASTLLVSWLLDAWGLTPQHVSLLLAVAPLVVLIGWSLYLTRRLTQTELTKQSEALPV